MLYHCDNNHHASPTFNCVEMMEVAGLGVAVPAEQLVPRRLLDALLEAADALQVRRREDVPARGEAVCAHLAGSPES